MNSGAVEVAVLEAGAGGRPLLLLHGFTGAKEDFADWLDPLAARGWHAVAPDHRGHGGSDAPGTEADYSLATLASDALGVADALGWSRFVLLGHSMGGMVAQLVALKTPERIRGLVLMDTAHGAVEGVDPELAALGVEVARTAGLGVIADLTADRPSPLSTPADERVKRERPGYVEFGDRKFRACSPAMYAALVVEMLSQPDRLDALAALHVATLVVVGEQDRPFLEPCRRLAATIPGARLVVLPDAGHGPQFEAPEAWWEAVAGFLDDVAGDTAQ